MSRPILQLFEYEHLPEPLQQVSKPCGDLAQQMNELMGGSLVANVIFGNHIFEAEFIDEEVQMGFRKLLEAKDCFVRAHMMRQKLLKKLEE